MSYDIKGFYKEIESEIDCGINFATWKKLSEKMDAYPESADLLFLAGKYKFHSQEFVKASSYFCGALKSGEQLAEKNAYYGLTLLKSQDVQKAESYIVEAFKQSPEDATALLASGLLAYTKKDYHAAAIYQEKGIVTGKHDFEFWKLRARILMKTGKSIDEIVPVIKKAQKMGEDHELDFDFAKLLFINEQEEECKKFCRKFMMKNPHSEYIEKFRQLVDKMKEKQKPSRKDSGKKTETAKQEQRPLKELLDELDQFIGLENVKASIKEMINVIEINRFKLERGLKASDVTAPHMIFYGNPGTGKTTIARLVGDIFYSIGLLKNGHLIEVKREDLVGQFIGDTEKNTKEKIEEALGGILFIDEAYSLVEGGNSNGNDFGQKAINVLLPALTNHRGEFAVIAAGYRDEMEIFLASNPGLKDRFTKKINFDDYSPEELMLIFHKLCRDKGNIMTDEANRMLEEELIRLYRKRDKTFSNGRLIHNFFETIITAQSNRIVSQIPKEKWTDDLIVTLTEEDVKSILANQNVKVFEVPINEELLQERVDRLNSFIGLHSVKKEINQLVSLVRYYKQEGKNTKGLIKHTLLLGNPGTGKTEVARILSGIYEALGILERGELIEVDRKGLVDKYRGGTEEKTARQIEKAIGGTLFIDEAYTLTNKDSNDPGHTAMEIILKKMSDLEGRFMVIAAGYSTEMEQFLDSNSGLRRRFGLELIFEDYTPDELMEITRLYIDDYQLSRAAETLLIEHYNTLYTKRDKTFGNAGFAKKIAAETVRNVHYRLSQLQSQESSQGIKTIEIEDIALLEN